MSAVTLSDPKRSADPTLWAQWERLLLDPAIRDLPYKVETNRAGQLIMTPHRPIHSFYQEAVSRLLKSQLPAGQTAPEVAIYTDQGIKVPDVVWMSMDRYRRAKQEVAATVAPEICVEVLSDRNSLSDIETKIALYFANGAHEVWICDAGHMRFYTAESGPSQQSNLAPRFPVYVELPE
jgi:Uma2 family endonuclease